ncbi:hypothetical protein ACFFLS_05605 [Flavobacterium procerum]|uniref:DUF695 domain-containing protein n=1 Tax=Flavobacterium procerum TaxID=1455569 RepID=A0ABV6BM29_9FLAO
MNIKDYLISLQFERDWQVEINSYNSLPIFDNTVVFSAINKTLGKEFYIEFENDETGYVLNEVILSRSNFCLNLDENSKIYNQISSNTNIDVLIGYLNKKTNPNDLDLMYLKINGGWKIFLNRLFNTNEKYDEIEFLFFAKRDNQIIEVSWIESAKYRATVGKTKYKNNSDFINNQELE